MQCLLASGGSHTLVGPMCWRLSQKLIFHILNNVNIVDYRDPNQSQSIHSLREMHVLLLINH